ncbi:hypothetical protein KY284_009811 [Solanum tuberosum]|nr:hypothetical protein KY284_009811 [Solanum tuberosum]
MQITHTGQVQIKTGHLKSESSFGGSAAMSKNSNGGSSVQRDQESSYDPVRWLNLMVSEPYYLFHLLVFFSYIPVRCAAFQILDPARNSFLLKREIQVFVAYCVLSVVKVNI